MRQTSPRHRRHHATASKPEPCALIHINQTIQVRGSNNTIFQGIGPSASSADLLEENKRLKRENALLLGIVENMAARIAGRQAAPGKK